MSNSYFKTFETNQKQKVMIEQYNFHRKQYEKWFSITLIFACLGGALPPLLLFLIFPLIKVSRYKKEYKRIEKECFLKSMENGADKEKYEKMYQYMKDQKRWWG